MAEQLVPGAKRSAASFRLIVLLGGLAAVSPLTIDLYLPAFPSLASDLGASPAQVQLTVASYLLGTLIGQVLIGSLSDVVGRRRPLLGGLACFVLVSFACMLATSAAGLSALRFPQGIAAGSCMVIVLAVVRDLASDTAAARLFSWIFLVIMVAPIVAPVIGSQLLEVTSWEGLFAAMGVYGAVFLAFAALSLPETLPPGQRRSGTLRSLGAGYTKLLRDRTFVAFALGNGLAIAAFLAYVTGSSVVLQNVYGLSAQEFSLVFALNAAGLMAISQLNRRLLRRWRPQRLLLAGLSITASGGLAFALFVLADLGLAAILPALFVMVTGVGMIFPNATAAALSDHPEIAGAASSLILVGQIGLSALAIPLVGIGNGDTALPLALTVAGLAVGGLVSYLVILRTRQALNLEHGAGRETH